MEEQKPIPEIEYSAPNFMSGEMNIVSYGHLEGEYQSQIRLANGLRNGGILSAEQYQQQVNDINAIRDNYLYKIQENNQK